MAINIDQIEGLSSKSAELARRIGEEEVIKAVRLLCVRHNAPFREDDPTWTVGNLMGLVATRTYDGLPGCQQPDIRKAAWETHNSLTREKVAAEILANAELF